nr:hypothetical protein CFP56_48598 [Quercus suber]
MDVHLRMWIQGEAGVLVDSLGKALLLSNDMHFWKDCKDKDIVLNLKWHAITCLVLFTSSHTDDPRPEGSVERELEMLGADLEEAEQKFYDEGFDDAERSG